MHDLLTALLVATTLAASAAGREPQGPAKPAGLLQHAKPGDVIFFSGQGLWAGIGARWSEPRFRHGHVGMIVLVNGAVRVVHAKGSPVNAGGRVRAEPLDTFLTGGDRVSLFRPKSPHAASRAALLVKGYADRRAPFDRAFSLQTPGAVYCTELIWRVLNVAYGADVVPRKRREHGRSIITLADLESSAHLHWLGTAELKTSSR